MVNFITFVINNGGTIISTLGGIGAAFAAFNVVQMINGVVTAIKAFTFVTEGATAAQIALNIAQKANAIGLIVAAVAGLVAGIILLWNTNEGFRNAVIGAWNAIAGAFTSAFNGIINFFTVTIPKTFNGFMDFIKTNWQGILLFLINPFAGAFKYMYDNFAGFRKFIDNFVATVKNIFNNFGNSFKDIGGNIVKGIWDGILGMAKWLKDKVNDFFGGIVKGVKGILGIKSPSRVFAGIGENMAAGIGVGFEKQIKKVSNVIQKTIPYANSQPYNLAFAGGGGGQTQTVYNQPNYYIVPSKGESTQQQLQAIKNAELLKKLRG
jgi:phage-related protein